MATSATSAVYIGNSGPDGAVQHTQIGTIDVTLDESGQFQQDDLTRSLGQLLIQAGKHICSLTSDSHAGVAAEATAAEYRITFDNYTVEHVAGDSIEFEDGMVAIRAGSEVVFWASAMDVQHIRRGPATRPTGV